MIQRGLLGLSFLFLLPITSQATGGPAAQIFVNGSSGTADLTNVFLALTGDRGVNATEANRYCVASTAGTLRDLYIKTNTAPGAGNTWTVTVFKNGAASGSPANLSTSVAGTSQTTNNDSTDEVTVAAGDTLTVKVTKGGTPGVTNLRFATRFIATNATESFYCGGGGANTLSTVNTEYISPFGQGVITATENNAKGLIPTSGTVVGMYIRLGTAPGAGATRTFTLMLNGNAQTVTCPISGGSATTCSDTADSFAVAAGDQVDIQSTNTLTINATTVKTSFLFRATTNGEFFIGNSSDTNLTNTANTFNEVDSASASNNATETNVDVLSLAMTIKNAYCAVQTGPAAGKTWGFNFRQNAASNGPSVTIANPNSTGNNSTTVVLSANDLLAWQVAPTGTPAVTPGSCSMTAFTSPRRMW